VEAADWYVPDLVINSCECAGHGMEKTAAMLQNHLNYANADVATAHSLPSSTKKRTMRLMSRMEKFRMTSSRCFAVLTAASLVTACSSAPSDEAATVSAPLALACASTTLWAPGVSYATGALVTYDGATYECILAHTSQSDWTPSAVPALWAPAACAGDPGAGGTAASGTIYFSNPGNTKGWSQLGPPGNGGSIVDSTIAYAGSGGSVESTCVYHGRNGMRYHSEPRWNGSWNHGTTYFGYALYVPKDWEFSGPERHVTAQFGIASGPGKTPDDYQHWIKNSLLQMGVNGADYTFGTMTAGQWHTVVTRFTYSTNGTGEIEGWFDGRVAFDVKKIDVKGGSGDGEALWALGLYEADWFGGKVGPQTTRSVFNAKIAIGTTYASVDPSK
jgi:hypothetical protein